MVAITERRLRARLDRVEALYRGATTAGEREAARRAGERLLARIEALRADDPIARFCRAHLAALGVPPSRPPPPTPLPSRRAISAVLGRWEAGEWSRDRLRRWAARLVDRVTLPADPEHPGACRAEVLLQLAALHLVKLRPGDAPRIRRFLEDGDWGAWFGLVATAAAR